jgi:hypothetical protein
LKIPLHPASKIYPSPFSIYPNYSYAYRNTPTNSR